MGMTITEQILAAHAGRDTVTPGQFIWAKLDLALGNDVTAPLAINEFRQYGGTKVFDPDRVCLVADHYVPNKDIKSAEQTKVMRDFAREQSIKHFYDAGRMGVEHALLPEQGIVAPGELIIGADSHTCTYGAIGAFSSGVGSTDLAAAFATGHVWLKVPPTIKFVYTGTLDKWSGGKDLILHTIGQISVSGALYCAMEFTGETIAALPMPDRLCMCNMAIEAGGKNGIIAPDECTRAYVDERVDREYTVYASDPDAEYKDVIELNVDGLGPVVACPDLPENTRPVGEVKDVKVDQVVIGSCTNGRLQDMEQAAAILRGKKVHPDVRLIVIPATQHVFTECVKRGIAEIVVEAGGVFSTPTCGPCLGGYMGVLAAGEVALATTNRNFVGRMGHLESKVYLSNPAVAAATAITGKISHPEDVT
jgi:3-isopropylmalate/(R)-2-methylmalate dehydratase large subunit